MRNFFILLLFSFSLTLTRLTTWWKIFRGDFIYNVIIATLELDSFDDTLKLLQKIISVQG